MPARAEVLEWVAFRAFNQRLHLAAGSFGIPLFTRQADERSFAISSFEGFASSLVTNDPLEFGPLARQSIAPIRSITERPSLSPASYACHPHSPPCGAACLPQAGCQAYHV
jgi:hypothetical protein